MEEPEGRRVYVLGIDTSTMICGVAICLKGRGVGGYETLVLKSHSRTLLHLIRSLLDLCRISLSDIDGFAVSCGPGSFTGLRIGMSTAKGLALATGRPVIGVPTLDAIARCAPLKENRVCAVLDAKRGEVYAALYERHHGKLSRITPDRVMPPEEFCEIVKEPTFFLGEGVERYGDILKSRLGDTLFSKGVPCLLPVARKVAEMGTALLRRPTIRLAGVFPSYVRRSDAETNWERRHGREDGV